MIIFFSNFDSLDLIITFSFIQVEQLLNALKILVLIFPIFRRLAEVWLDEYKKFFYEIAPDAKTLDMGSLEEQLANKKRLNCKPFKFFITDVVKDMYPPTLLSFTNGGLSPSKNPTLCLDTYAKKSGDIKLYGCHHQVRMVIL